MAKLSEKFHLFADREKQREFHVTVQLARLARLLHIGEFSFDNDRGNGGSQRTFEAIHPGAEVAGPGRVNLAHALYGPMLTFDADTIIGESLRTTGSFQEFKIGEVSQFLAKAYNFRPEIFIDIGANIGTHLVFALKEAGFREGFGVEPDTNNYRLLVCNVLLNGLEGRTSLFNIALSDDVGWAELELANGNFGDHRIRSTIGEYALSFGESERRSYKVPRTHAGRWITDVGPDLNCTLTWVDTQGHEGNIFRCFLGAQSYAPPRYLVAEFWPYGLERSGGKNSYLQYLERCDAVYDINKENWAQSSPASIDSLTAMYERMLAETTAVHYPHTDLLCICGS